MKNFIYRFSGINFITVFFLSFAYYLYYQHVHPLLGDEFNILVQAQRVIEGQVPYRDFFQFTTPGSIYLSGLWLFLFGNSIWSIKIFSALEGALIALLLYLLIKRVLSSKIIISIVLLFTLCFSTTYWPFVSHHWLSTITALFALLFMSRFVDSKSAIHLSLSGLFAGFTLIVLQNKGGLIFLALLLFVFINIFLSGHYGTDFQNKFRLLGRHGFLLTSFFSLPFLVLIAYLYFNNAIGDFIYDTLVWVTGPYKRFNAYPNYFFMGNYAIYKIYTENPFPLNILRIRDVLVIGYLPPVIIGLSIFHSIVILKKRVESLSVRGLRIILFTISGLFMFLSILYRSDIVHITFVFPFVLLLLGVLLDNWLGMFYQFSRVKKSVLVLIISFFLLYVSYGAVARIRLASNFKYSFDTKIGRFYTYKKSVSDFYEDLFRTVDEKVTDDNTFVYLWSSFVYFISGKKNPTRFDSVIPGYNTEEQLREIVEELENAKVRYIFYDGLDVGIAMDPLAASYPSARVNLDNPLNNYLSEKFEVTYEIRFDENATSYKILKRKDIK